MRWLLLVGLIGCSGDDKTDSDSGDIVTETGDPRTTTMPAVEYSGGIEGVITDASGQGVGEAKMKFCIPNGLCITATADSDGSFAIPNTADETYAFEIAGKTGDGLATTVFPVTIAGEVITQNVVLPALDSPTAMPASASEVEMGDGMFITIGADVLTPPLFIDAATEVAGVRVPSELWVAGPPGQNMVAQWHLSPYNHEAELGLPLRVANDLSAADGDVYQVWVSDYYQGAWVNIGSLTANGDWLEGDASLSIVSTVALTQ